MNPFATWADPGAALSAWSSSGRVHDNGCVRETRIKLRGENVHVKIIRCRTKNNKSSSD